MRQLFFLFFLMGGSIFYGQNSFHPKTVLSQKNGFPSNYFYTVTVDNEDYAWVCTDNGVVKYNGNYSKLFQIDNGLPSNDVFDIYIDKKNRKWLMGYFTGLFFIENDIVHKVKNTSQLNDVRFSYVKDGVCYFIENNTKIYFYDEFKKELTFFKNTKINERYELVKYIDLIKNFLIHDLIEKKYYTYNLETKKISTIPTQFSLVYDSNSYPLLVKNNSILTNKKLRCVSKHFDEKIILTDEEQFYIFKNRELNRNLSKELNKLNLNPKNIGRILIDKKNNKWITSLNTFEINLYKNNSHLFNNKVLDNLQEYEKIKFVCYNNGFTYFTTTRNNFYAYNLKHEELFFIKKFNSELYISNLYNNGDHFYFNISGFNLEYELNGTKIKLITSNDRFYRFDYLENNNKYGISGTKIYKNDELFFSKKNDLRYNYLKEIDKAVLFTNEENVYKYNLEKKQLIKNAKITFTSKIEKVTNNLIIVTNSNNLFITTLDLDILNQVKLGNEIIYSSCLNNTNTKMYVATNENIYCYDVVKNNLKLQAKISNLENGLEHKIINLKIINNSLIACSEKGFTNIDLTVFQQKYDGIIDLDYIKINEKLLVNFENLSFERTENDLNIKTSIKSFNSNKSDYLTYYSLSTNKENKWRLFEEEILSFKNLSHGDYTLKVYAKKNINEEIKNVKTIHFIIKPYFWKTNLFFYTCIVFVVLIIFIIINFFKVKNLKKYNLKLSFMNLEIKALKSQMNPHFIFNVINNLQSTIILEDEIKINTFFTKFSKLLRTTLDIVNKEVITLQDEMSYIRSYVELEQLRLKDTFLFNLKNTENIDLKAINIPVMLLQPIVENAIIHGLIPSKKKKILSISIEKSRTEGYLDIIIEDNGIGRINKLVNKSHNAIALKTIEERFTIINKIKKSKYNIKIIDLIEDKTPTGTKVILTILKSS